MAKYTTQQIIEQFKKTHSETFDYSLVEYKHSQTKVKIICRIHGVFEQLVGMHRKGQGCAKCMYDDKRHSKKTVIAKFKTVHGERYDYVKVKYANVDTKVAIICEIHGIFEQTPYHHQMGSGCPKCVGKNKTQDEVLVLFKEVHGNKYDYSRVEFVDVSTKVTIICPEHGEFKQIPQGHYSGKGCIKCSGTYQYNTEEIIDKFINVHGRKYLYDKVDYTSSHSKVKIICTIHGIFEQTAGSHLSGCGCPECGGSHPYTTKTIIEEFVKTHGNRYIYSKVCYENIHKEVKIICRTHGSFYQIANGHRYGSGCPDCATPIGYTKDSYLEYCARYDGETFLYLIKCESKDEYFYKVGIARQGANNRFNSKQKMPYNFEVISEVKGDASLIWDLESAIHRLLGKYKYKPNKDFHGKSECFFKVPADIKKMIDDFNNTKQGSFIL